MILPQNPKKCLYLDVDTIILSDLYELYHTNISNVYPNILKENKINDLEKIFYCKFD